MRKCRGTEVPTIVIALAEECTAGERFNWAQLLCEEFLTNCREVQEEGKTFHYAWLLVSIVCGLGLARSRHICVTLGAQGC